MMRKIPLSPVKVPGLDWSHYQASIDFAKVVAAGRVFGWGKAWEYSVDPTYKIKDRAARAAGLIVGAYDYLHPSKDGLAQAESFLSAANIQHGDLRPILDWETTDNVPTGADIANAQKWLDRVEKEIGVPPGIYLGPYFGEALKLPASFKRYPLCIAHYGVNIPLIPDPWDACTFHQYADHGPLNGIPDGHEDLDWFNGTSDQLKAILL